jgi:hypothetical protein
VEVEGAGERSGGARTDFRSGSRDAECARNPTLGANKGYASNNYYFITKTIPFLVEQNVGLVPEWTSPRAFGLWYIASAFFSVVPYRTYFFYDVS